MAKVIAISIAALLLASAPVEACLARIMPFSDKPDLYSDIFVATVQAAETTGIIMLRGISGCGVPVPEVGQWTTFYLKGDTVVPGVYSPLAGQSSPRLFNTEMSDG